MLAISRPFGARPQSHLVDLDFAFVERFQAVDAAQQRALAAAGRADDRRHFAAAHGERDAVEHAQGAVVFHQVANFDHLLSLIHSYRRRTGEL